MKKRPDLTKTLGVLQEKRTARTSSAADDKRPPSRKKKNVVMAYFEPEVTIQLKVLAAQEQKTIQRMIAESLNLLFHHYGKPPIAPES